MKALDDEIRLVHETYWERQQNLARRKLVLLVEGDDDRDVVHEIFKRRSRTFSNRVVVVVAGGRAPVPRRMESTFPDALGLVDRDTWTDGEVTLERQRQPRLHVTEGWCLENIFLDPAWLRAYDRSVAENVASQRERWVQAGALWWTLQRAREAQQRWQEALGWSYGAPRDDIDLTSARALVDSLNRRIPEAVRSEARFDLDAMAETFMKRRDEILALPEATQWQVGVHGKRAFNELLVPALQAAGRDRPGWRGSDRLNWRVELAGAVDRPAPLDTLLALLLP